MNVFFKNFNAERDANTMIRLMRALPIQLAHIKESLTDADENTEFGKMIMEFDFKTRMVIADDLPGDPIHFSEFCDE